MPSKALQTRLRVLAERHREALSSLIDQGDTRADHLYREIAVRIGESRVWDTLSRDLLALVQDCRTRAKALSRDHFGAELAATIGAANTAKVELDSGAEPDADDVRGYVENAVAASRRAVSDADDLGKSIVEAFEHSVFHAKTIIESEATVQYKKTRDALNSCLLALSDDEAEALGFITATTQAQLNTLAAEPVELRDDQHSIAVLGERWDARASACERCKSADGEIRPIGFSFSQPGPTVHARCQCVRTLWAVLVPWPSSERSHAPACRPTSATQERNAMPHDSTQPVGRDDAGIDRAKLAYFDVEVDTRALKVDEQTRTIRGAVASDESIDSHGSKIVAKGWRFTRFANNPVLMWNHAWARYSCPAKPEDMLGNASAAVKKGQLLSDLRFDTKEVNPCAEMVYQQFKSGTVRMLSVGFYPVKYHYEAQGEGQRDLLVIDEAELLEISVVPIGANANANAGIYGMRDGIRCELRDLLPPATPPAQQLAQRSEPEPGEEQCRGAVPYKKFPTAEASKWDGPAAEKSIRAFYTDSKGNVDWAGYRSCFAWYDADKPEAFGSYKLLHCDVVGGKVVTVDSGVMAAGAACMGSRGGVNIPDADMPAVKSHLGKHYAEFKKTAPWDAKKDASGEGGEPSVVGDSQAASAQAGACPESHARESLMDKTILEVFGLKAESPETEVLAAATRQRDQLASLITLLGADSFDAAVGKFHALKSVADKVPVLEKRNADLLAAGEQRDRADLIRDHAAKFTPAELSETGWVKSASLETLRTYVKSAPDRVASTPTQQPAVAPRRELTPEQRIVARSFGLSEDEMIKAVEAEEGGAK